PPIAREPETAVASGAHCGCGDPGSKSETRLEPSMTPGDGIHVAVSRAVEKFVASRSSRTAAQPQASPPPAPAPAAAIPAPPKPRPVEFVSEAEIRAALKRKEK